MSVGHIGPRQCVARRARRMHVALVTAGALLACTPGFLGAQTPAFTERQAVEMALSQAPYRAAEAGRIAIAESVVAQAGLPPNPTVAATHERLSVTGGHGTESALQISQAFDI